MCFRVNTLPQSSSPPRSLPETHGCSASAPIELKENVWGGAVNADMNADCKNDLVLGAKKEHVLILLGDGAGGFDKDLVLVPIGGKAPGNIAVADVNRDGKLGLVTSNYESGDVSVLLQQ